MFLRVAPGVWGSPRRGPQPEQAPRFYKLHELAEETGIGHGKLLVLCQTGQLQSVRVLGRTSQYMVRAEWVTESVDDNVSRRGFPRARQSDERLCPVSAVPAELRRENQ